MKRFIGFWIFVSLLSVPVWAQNTLTEKEKEEGFTLLFDGKTLSPELWQGDLKGYPVEDGAIVCRGRNIATNKEYPNFIFRFEFKLPPGGNNGVGIRTGTPEKELSFKDGAEIQILDNSADKHKNIKPYQAHGSLYGLVPAKRNPEKFDYQKPIGEWNEQEIVLDGPNLKITLNGEVIVDADLDAVKAAPSMDGHEHPALERATGFVALLGHNDPVAFRSLRIKEIPAKTDKKEADTTK